MSKIRRGANERVLGNDYLFILFAHLLADYFTFMPECRPGRPGHQQIRLPLSGFLLGRGRFGGQDGATSPPPPRPAKTKRTVNFMDKRQAPETDSLNREPRQPREKGKTRAAANERIEAKNKNSRLRLCAF
jgi:hypothetical protein